MKDQKRRSTLAVPSCPLLSFLFWGSHKTARGEEHQEKRELGRPRGQKWKEKGEEEEDEGGDESDDSRKSKKNYI